MTSEEWQKKEGLSIEEMATIAHQQRVWQVRKYCQVKPSIALYSLDGTDSERENAGTVSLHADDETADPALAALLRGVLKQLNADIVGTWIALFVNRMLICAGYDLAPGRPHTVLSIWSHQW